jgi:quercetin dioxygenase-like cupin family protein
MGLMVKRADFPAKPRGSKRRKVTQCIYGTDLSFSLSTVEAGFASAPNVHNSEELAHVMSGELEFWIEGRRAVVKAGDFVRVPKMVVHWIVNASGSEATLIQSHCPAILVSSDPAGNIGLFEDKERRPPTPSTPIWLSPNYLSKPPEFPQIQSLERLHVPAAGVLDSEHFQMAAAGRLTSKFVYGLDSNLMKAKRVGGYHSKPHVHDCEQLNLLMEGELWVFLEDQAFFMKPGDFLRIPRGRHHWAWNTGKGECLLLENHSPVLNPAAKPNAKPLLTDAESSRLGYIAVNYWSPESICEREQALMSKAGAAVTHA